VWSYSAKSLYWLHCGGSKATVSPLTREGAYAVAEQELDAGSGDAPLV